MTENESERRKPWLDIASYEPLEDWQIKDLLLQEGIRPRTVNYRMFQVVQYGKEPGLNGLVDVPSTTQVAFSPADARELFRRRLVPGQWLVRMASIAAYDDDREQTSPVS